jgi:hypothetical protein
MEKHIQQIIALIEANIAIKENRTPFLDVSLGGLRTALANANEHVAELERIAAATAAATTATASAATPATEEVSAPDKA